MGGQASSESTAPIHDTPILGFKTRPRVQSAQEWGNASNFWVECGLYFFLSSPQCHPTNTRRTDPSGLVDLTRTTHLPTDANEPELKSDQLDLPVDGDRVIRLDPAKTAYVIVDMQK